MQLLPDQMRLVLASNVYSQQKRGNDEMTHEMTQTNRHIQTQALNGTCTFNDALLSIKS